MKQLIGRMLAKRAEDRPTAEEALNSEWILNAPVEFQEH